MVDLAFGGSIDELGAKTNDKGSKKEDIDAFLREATELVKVIHKYSATIERERQAAEKAARLERRGIPDADGNYPNPDEDDEDEEIDDDDTDEDDDDEDDDDDEEEVQA